MHSSPSPCLPKSSFSASNLRVPVLNCSLLNSAFTGRISGAPVSGGSAATIASAASFSGHVSLYDRTSAATSDATSAHRTPLLLVECRRGRSSPYDRDRGGNRDGEGKRERGGNRDRSGNGDAGRSGPLGAGGDKADVAQHPYAIKIVTPPARELGIHCLPLNTQCGETVEIEGESYVVLGVTYRYRLHKGRYTARERQLDVQSRGRFLVNMYLTDMLDRS
ncbi:unnamed protein product [Closterium sp. Yama58-4]|nr:unnamed protein product [Closterium sp. Yama58-4]